MFVSLRVDCSCAYDVHLRAGAVGRLTLTLARMERAQTSVGRCCFFVAGRLSAEIRQQPGTTDGSHCGSWNRNNE